MEFTVYTVKATLLEPMLGTVPKNEEVYTQYIAKRKAEKAGVTLTEEQVSEERASVPTPEHDQERSGWTGFHGDADGIFVYNYMISGYLKECGNILKEQLGIKNLRSKIDHFITIEPRRIRLKDAPDGVIERPLRAMTMQGPRVALAKSDYVNEGTVLHFSIRVLDNKEINQEVIEEILTYGQYKGALGQFRNGGYGRIEYEITNIEKQKPNKPKRHSGKGKG